MGEREINIVFVHYPNYRMAQLDPEKFETVVQNNKKHLGQFLNKFDNMPKVPDMVENKKEEKYQTQMKSYIDEMELKIKDLKETKYDNFGNHEKFDNHEYCSNNCDRSDLFVRAYGHHRNLKSYLKGENAKMHEKVLLLRNCICKQIQMSDRFEESPFEIFKWLHLVHL